jgi:hypothetical protein
MNRQTVIDAFKEAGLNDHQAEQVGYLYKQMGILKYDAHGGTDGYADNSILSFEEVTT